LKGKTISKWNPWLRLSTLLGVALAAAACASSAPDVGEKCDKAGDVAACVETALCTNETGGALTCRKRCTVQTDCASTEACNGVSGSNLKSCQPATK
jgi:hypothetical protein